MLNSGVRLLLDRAHRSREKVVANRCCEDCDSRGTCLLHLVPPVACRLLGDGVEHPKRLDQVAGLRTGAEIALEQAGSVAAPGELGYSG